VTGLDGMVGRYEIASASGMERLGRRMGGMLSAGDLVVLTGPLGAGKTTLTRGIAEGLRVRGPVQSPTFVIARTHPSLIGEAPLVHVDAYRLGSALELDDLDIDVEGSVVVVEWGRGMADGLRETWWEVEIERAVGGAVDVRGADAGARAADAGAGAGNAGAGAGDAGARDGNVGAGDGNAGARDGASGVWDEDEDTDDPRVVTISRGPRS